MVFEPAHAVGQALRHVAATGFHLDRLGRNRNLGGDHAAHLGRPYTRSNQAVGGIPQPRPAQKQGTRVKQVLRSLVRLRWNRVAVTHHAAARARNRHAILGQSLGGSYRPYLQHVAHGNLALRLVVQAVVEVKLAEAVERPVGILHHLLRHNMPVQVFGLARPDTAVANRAVVLLVGQGLEHRSPPREVRARLGLAHVRNDFPHFVI